MEIPLAFFDQTTIISDKQSIMFDKKKTISLETINFKYEE